MTAVEVRGLRKAYGDVQALEDVSFRVAPRTVFGLLGPNGAGKSTTVKCLTTLARPDGGEAYVDGHDVLADPLAVRRSIGVVAQAHGSDPELTGRENLVLQAELQRIRGKAARARADELLEVFDLTEAGGRLVSGWSGGMKRRLDVALGLVHRPSVLFLDEPTTGLDPEVRADMWREIERLRDDEGMTIVLTTHYLEEAEKLAAEVAIVDRGHIVASGRPGDLMAQLGPGKTLHDVYLHHAGRPISGDGVGGVQTLEAVA